MAEASITLSATAARRIWRELHILKRNPYDNRPYWECLSCGGFSYRGGRPSIDHRGACPVRMLARQLKRLEQVPQ